MYYNYIKCEAICLGIEQLIKIRGKPLAKALNRQLAVFPTIRRPCTDFLTGLSACLPACLPVCVSDLIWEKGRPDRRLWSIRIVLYSRSLAVHSNGGCLGCLLRRPWFDLIWGRADIKALVQFDRSTESFVVFAGWLFKQSSSGFKAVV